MRKTPKMKSEIAVLEGKWWDDYNITIRGLFDLISDLNFGSPHQYYYEMFSDGDSLERIIKRASKISTYLAIAAHGDEKGIEAPGGRISRTKLRNILRETRGKIKGVFIDSCGFTNENNVQFILGGRDNKTPILWIAGFKEYVDFIDSSSFSMIFWNAILKNHKKKESIKIRDVSKEIIQKSSGLAKSLGFHIFARKRGPNGGVEDLMKEIY